MVEFLPPKMVQYTLKHMQNKALYTRAVFSIQTGAPVAQLDRRWSTDLVVSGSRPAEGGNLFSPKRGFIALSL